MFCDDGVYNAHAVRFQSHFYLEIKKYFALGFNKTKIALQFVALFAFEFFGSLLYLLRPMFYIICGRTAGATIGAWQTLDLQ